jgi:hypothetical protein
MIKPMPVKIAPAEARAMVLRSLRFHNYTGKTSEIASWSGLHVSVVRRAGLALANENKIEAVLVPGRGKGEYRFTITQLDLFEDGKLAQSKFPKMGEILEKLAIVKTKLLLWRLRKK